MHIIPVHIDCLHTMYNTDIPPIINGITLISNCHVISKNKSETSEIKVCIYPVCVLAIFSIVIDCTLLK